MHHALRPAWLFSLSGCDIGQPDRLARAGQGDMAPPMTIGAVAGILPGPSGARHISCPI
jgi:hypothetical protein